MTTSLKSAARIAGMFLKSMPKAPHWFVGARFRVVKPLFLFVLLAGAAFSQDFDLVASHSDANGIPLNPAWRWQLITATNQPQTDPQKQALLQTFPWPTPLSSDDLPASLLPFSSQHPTQDTYHGGTLFGLCNCVFFEDEGEIQSGHLNFAEVTYTGFLRGAFDHSTGPLGLHTPGFFDDDDVSTELDTSAAALSEYHPHLVWGPGALGPDHATIHLEFKFAETLANYKLFPTPVGGPFGSYWVTLADSIDPDPAKAEKMTNGHEAIVVGLMGLDAVHPPAMPELHPVHGLAIRENNTDGSAPDQDDFWALFARKSGNEGECSSNQHELNRGFITFKIPPPVAFRQANGDPLPGVVAKLKAGPIVSISGSLPAQPSSFSSDAKGTFITLGMPPDTGQGFPFSTFGEVHLHWSAPNEPCIDGTNVTNGQPCTPPPPFRIPRVFGHPPEDEPETQLQYVWNQLSADQKRLAASVIATLVPPAPAVRARKPVPLVILNAPPPPPPGPPVVTDSPDTAGVAKIQAGFQALCIATNGKIPLYRGACAQFQPVTTLTPIGANGGPVSSQPNGSYASPLFVLPQAISHSGHPILETVLTLSPPGQTIRVPAGSTAPVQIPTGITTVTYQSRDTLGNVEALHTQTFHVGPKI